MSTTLSSAPRPSSSSDGSENNNTCTSAPSPITTATLRDEEANALPLDATQSEEPVQEWECSNQQDTSSDDDEMTIITLEHNHLDDHDQNAAALAWLDQNGPEMERRRRNVLLRELQRVQRASFIHFMLLCLIPTALLLIVVVTVFGEEEPCGSEVTTCRQEARTFINAFTTRCICDAIDVKREQ